MRDGVVKLDGVRAGLNRQIHRPRIRIIEPGDGEMRDDRSVQSD